MIVDIPGRGKAEIAEYFCYRISNEGFNKVQFSFYGVTNVPRIILSGNTADVLRLVNGYFQEYPLDQSAI